MPPRLHFPPRSSPSESQITRSPALNPRKPSRTINAKTLAHNQWRRSRVDPPRASRSGFPYSDDRRAKNNCAPNAAIYRRTTPWFPLPHPSRASADLPSGAERSELVLPKVRLHPVNQNPILLVVTVEISRFAKLLTIISLRCALVVHGTANRALFLNIPWS